MENKEYTWYPENSGTFYETYSSVEECIEAAKQEYKDKTGEFYGCDDRYSPIINIGSVEHIDYNRLVNLAYDIVRDCTHDEIDCFAFGTNFETECYYDDKKEVENKEKLMDVIKSLYINPSSKCRVFKEKYDIINENWIDANYKI